MHNHTELVPYYHSPRWFRKIQFLHLGNTYGWWGQNEMVLRVENTTEMIQYQLPSLCADARMGLSSSPTDTKKPCLK
jgi:hypothetical protein